MSKSSESFNLHDISPFIKIAILITILNTFILDFKRHFEDLEANHIGFVLKNLYSLLKRKYEPNKYMLISQTKISAKSVTNFLDTVHLHANLKISIKYFKTSPCFSKFLQGFSYQKLRNFNLTLKSP